jgi:hypothetical protein
MREGLALVVPSGGRPVAPLQHIRPGTWLRCTDIILNTYISQLGNRINGISLGRLGVEGGLGGQFQDPPNVVRGIAPLPAYPLGQRDPARFLPTSDALDAHAAGVGDIANTELQAVGHQGDGRDTLDGLSP